MPTELIYSIFFALFLLTGVGFFFAIMFALSCWCITEGAAIKVGELRPCRLAWVSGRFALALAVA